jgi:hypothetical protein
MVTMGVFVVGPYIQEWWRCYTYERNLAAEVKQ